MTTNVTKTEENKAIAATQADAQEMGFKFDPKTTVLPRILLAQKMSKVVDEGRFTPGEIYNSLSGEKLGGLGSAKEEFEVIPLSVKEVWTVLEKEGNEFVTIEDVTPQNAKREWEGQMEWRGETLDVKYQRTLQFMVLIAKGLGEEQILPAQVSFKVKSLPAGKKLNSFVLERAAMGHAPYTKTVKLWSKPETNAEKKTYHVYEAAPGQLTTEEQRRIGKMWTEQMKKNTYSVQPEGDDEVEAPEEDAKY